MLSKLRTPGLLLCIASIAFAAKTPTAAQVLDRYIEVTGGRAAWLSKVTETDEIEGRMPDAGRIVLRATVSTSRAGNALTHLTVPEDAHEGVYNGVAWAMTDLAGARIKHDLDRDEALRSARMLEEGNWRELYPKARLEAIEDLDGCRCYRIALSARKTEWFDIKTGLLVKQISTGAIDYRYTVEAWSREAGLLQPSTLLTERNGVSYRVQVLKVTYNAGESFAWPHPVEALASDERAGRALPNAEELIERHIFASGGADAFQNIRTQHITGTLEFVEKNLAAETEALSAGGGRYYQAVDMPGLGKNEQGSDGRVAWERSPTLGPRAKERHDMSGLGLTLEAAQVVGWRYLLRSVETEARETIDGHDCYRVHLVSRDGSDGGLRWYDRASGLLYRTSAPMKTDMGLLPTVTTYLAYKPVAGLQWPVLIRMAMAGQELVFTARNVELNHPVDDAAFGLPEEIRALAK